MSNICEASTENSDAPCMATMRLNELRFVSARKLARKARRARTGSLPMDGIDEEKLFLSVVTLAELRYGVERTGNRKSPPAV